MCAFIAGVTSTVALESIGYDISKPATGLGILGFFIIGYLNSKPHPIINTIIYSLVFSIIIILIGAVSAQTERKQLETTIQELKDNPPIIEYDIKQTDKGICGGGQDYSSCINMHVAVYNQVCTMNDLSESAKNTCAELLAFIDKGKARLPSCGYGCTTSADENGMWGWSYLEMSKVTRYSNPEQEKTLKCLQNLDIDGLAPQEQLDYCNNLWAFPQKML